MSSASPTMRCKCRRQAVTTLRCARCSVPICPQCSIVAPAGQLCRECADNRPSRLYQVNTGTLGRTALACLATALFGGWILTGVGAGYGFFQLWGAFFYAIILTEVALRMSGRKRGLKMEILVGSCAVIGLLGGTLLNATQRGAEPLEVLLQFFLQPWNWVALLIAVGISIARLRDP